jgi:uncharacterized protein
LWRLAAKKRRERRASGVPSDQEIAVHIEALRRLEHEVAEVEVPLSYMDEYYSLRMHIQLILSKLERLAAERGIDVGSAVLTRGAGADLPPSGRG